MNSLTALNNTKYNGKFKEISADLRRTIVDLHNSGMSPGDISKLM